MTALQQSTTASAVATEQQVLQAKEKVTKKGPTNNKLPKFHNKQQESFIDWYEDVLCILSLSEWEGIYDPTLNDITATTTPSNAALSEHLYTSLRLALQGDAGRIMKTNENKFRQMGVEYLHSMKPIFDPKWPETLHAKKLSTFCEFYRTPTTSIDQYSTQFKQSLRALRYNNIIISPTTAKHTFLQGLGSEFISIRNMSTLPVDFQTTDIDSLTKAAREHLARVIGNREIQRQQHRQNQQRANPRTPAPAPTSAPSHTPTPTAIPNPTPPSNTTQPTDPNLNLPPTRPPTIQQDFQKEIMREIGFRVHTPSRISYWQQLAGPGMCYYHRTAHSSQTCTIIQRATARANAGTIPTSTFIPNPAFQSTPSTNPTAPAPTPPTTTHPTARHVTTDTPSESDSSDVNPVEINSSNFDSDYYMSSSNNVALSNINPNQPLYRFVVDSGATQHMCCDRDFFTSMTHTAQNTPTYVKLGDGTTKCPIMGHGTVQLLLNQKTIRLHNVLYVPDLEVSLFSIKTHMKIQGCYEHSENNVCTIAFPTFTIDAITNDEIEFYTKPSDTNTPDFDDSQHTLNILPQSIPYIRSPQQRDHVQITSIHKTKPIQYTPSRSSEGAAGYDLHSNSNTSIPPNTRKTIGLGFSMAIPEGLYGRIAPRSGLAVKHQIDIAAGVIDPDYRGEVKVLLVNTSQKRFDIKSGDRIAQIIFERIALPAFHTLKSLPHTSRNQGGFGSTGISARLASTREKESPTTPTQSPSSPPTSHVPPPIRTIDKPQPVVAADRTVTIDDLRKLIGFRNAESLIPHLRDCFKPNFHLSTIDRDPVLNLGEVATIDKSKISRRPVPLPKHFGDVMHVDIGYGCNAGLSGIKYALFVVDRATRHKYIYPLKSLENDVIKAFQSLVKDIGFAPRKIVTDFDYKLMGNKITDYFTPQGTILECAPPRHQHKNGLVERNWRTVVRMARSWLTASLLPSSFWYFAIRRAVEVSNYMPINVKGLITTPFQLVHHQQPDLHSLIPLFSIAYIDHPMTNNTHNEAMSTQTLRTILIGKSDKSSALEFYHPPSKQIITKNAIGDN